MNWDTDTGLTVRMAVALGMVIVLPIAFIDAFVFAINAVGLDFLAWATGDPYNGRVYVELWLAIGAVVVGLLLQLQLGDSVALRSVTASHVDESERPELHRRVGRLAQIADVEPPRLAVSRSDVPNAFTVGVRPSAATIVVTEGALEALSDDELDAVLAHELAHDVTHKNVSDGPFLADSGVIVLVGDQPLCHYPTGT